VWQVGGRGKRKTPEIGETLRSRAVFFDDGGSAMVSSMLSQGVGESIKAGGGDIKIGHRAMQGASSDARQSERNDVEFEIDHKRFGFRLAEPLLVAAFGMIRALLPPGLEWDYRVLHEMGHCIIKTIILPGGWVYRCTFGNWSGPWTSILDSFCNWIAMSGAMHELKLKPENVDLWIYGDDTLLGFRNGSCPLGLTPPDVQEILRRRFGIYAGEWNIGRLSSYGSAAGATFLGCWNRDGFHGRPLSKWVDISVLPEKPREGIGHQLKRMRYLTHAAVATKDNEDYFTSYFMWLNEKLPLRVRKPEDELRQSLKTTFVRSHSNFSSGGVDWRDWEYGAKLTLCELMKKCRGYQRLLHQRELTGRPNYERSLRRRSWLRAENRGVPISVCGIEKGDVADFLSTWPATAL
jgi:hypothetical protein